MALFHGGFKQMEFMWSSLSRDLWVLDSVDRELCWHTPELQFELL